MAAKPFAMKTAGVFLPLLKPSRYKRVSTSSNKAPSGQIAEALATLARPARLLPTL